MKPKQKRILTIILSILLIVTYMVPGSVFADSAGISGEAEAIEASADEADLSDASDTAEDPGVFDEESPDNASPGDIEDEPSEQVVSDGVSDVTDEAEADIPDEEEPVEPGNESGEMDEESGDSAEVLDAEGSGTYSADQTDDQDVTATEEKVEEKETEKPVKRAASKSGGGKTILAFTSDIHNSSDNTAANRLDGWLDYVEGIYDGDVDVMSFCGDMGAASANESQFWTYTQAVMNVVSDQGIPAVYTTGNHEFYNGKYDTTSNSVKNSYIVGDVGKEGSNYIIYCLGTDNWNNNSDNFTTGQITKLTNYLGSIGSEKPIIVLTHFPLHRYSSRSTTNADKVIDALNDAAAAGKKITVLWGHNHTMSDTFYDQIYLPGDTIPYNSSGSTKTIQFYYGAAGCMSDTEYGSGSAYVKGKGLVITIDSENRMSFTYHDAKGNNVTEGGTYTEQPPVSAEGVSVSPQELEVEVGRSGKLTVSFTPADTTNKGVTWSSSDENVATVTNGKVKGVSVGTTTITATSVDGGFTATCAVNVIPRSTEEVNYVIRIGDSVLSTERSDDEASSSSGGGSWGGWGGSSNTYTGLAAVEYSSAVGADEETRWVIEETDDGSGYYIMSLDGRYLNATYTSSGGSYFGGSSQGDLKLDDTPDVWVLDSGVDLDSWEVDGSYLKSTNASNGNSSDKYLTVETGTGGSKLFTVRSQDSASETFIEDADSLTSEINATAIAVSPKKTSIEVGATKELKVTYTPAETTNKNVTWTSSDESIATVSASGVVTGVAKGTATITATYTGGELTDTCEVTVTKPAGSGVTPEPGKKYVILAGDGYALTSEGDEVGYSNGSADSGQYNYKGLTGEAYTVGSDVIPERLLWTFTAATRDGNSYYIQSQDGRYLNGTYVSNSTGGYDGTLKLDDTPDIWVISGSTSEGTVNANLLKSTNASQSDAGDKYLTHGNGDESVDNIFSLRSEDNATPTAFYEYTDDGTYVPDPDDPVVPPTPADGSVYKLVDQFTSGKEYLIVSTNSAGSGYALNNPGGSSSGASMGRTAVTIENGDIDGDGAADKYISTEDEDLIWTATANGSGFNITNNGDYLEGKSGEVKIYSSQQYADRYWTYDGNQLKHSGGQNTYVVYYSSNNFTSTYNSTDSKIYIYEKTEPVQGDDPVESVELDKTELTLTEGETGKLTATVLPTTAADKTVTWSSSDETVATVDQAGNVTAVKEGAATITVTTNDGGKTADCAVTVNAFVAPELPTYKLVDQFTSGKEYLIVSANSAGSGYALTNPGGTSSGATMGRTAVTIENGDIDGDGTFDMYISTEATDVVWTATTNSSGFDVTNSGDYLEGKSGNVRIYNSQQYTDRYWTYENNQLKHVGGSNSYSVYYSNSNFTSSTSSNSNKIYIYEKIEPVQGDDPVTGVELDKTEITLTEGETDKLTATVLPATAADKTVTWSTSDETVATVDQTGNVTAVKEGTATITVTTNDGGKTAECTVTVNAFVPPEETTYKLVDQFTSGKEYLIVSTNSAGSGNALTNPGGSSSGATMGSTAVTIQNGDVDGDGTSDMYISTEASNVVWTVTTNGSGFDVRNNGDYIEGKSGDVKIYNSQQYPNRYWTYNNNYLLHEGGSYTYELYYNNGFTMRQYNSGNPTNKIYIYEKTEPVQGDDPVTGVELDKTELTLTEGETDKLTATVLPATAADKTVTWSSSDESIATVDQNGNVTAVKEGTAIITVTTNDGDFTDTCSVTVEAYVAPEGIKYVLTDKLEAGKKYVIASSNVAGSTYILGHDGETAKTYGSEILNEEGQLTIITEKEDVAFESSEITNGFSLTNSGYYMTVEGSGTLTFGTASSTKYWKYANNKLSNSSSSADRYLTFSSNEFKGYYSSSNPNPSDIFLFVEKSGETHEHTWGDWEVTTPATCTEKGEETRTCSECGAAETREIEPTGHEWGEPTYEWADDNSSVTATRVCGHDATHIDTETVETTSEVTKAATCEAKGETTYTATFTNEAFAEQVKTVENIPAIGHDWGEPSYAWTDDNSSVTATRVCKNEASHKETETVETTSEVTKEPTCLTKGETTYTAVFENDAFSTQTLTVEDIAATGHDWNETEYEWAEDNSSVTATRTCKNDPAHVETETVNATYAIETPATCTEDGTGIWVSAQFANKDFEIQTKEVEIEATGHEWSEVTYTWSDDNTSVTAVRTCTNDTSHVQEETASATFEVITPATSTTAGQGVWTSAEFENEAFAVQTKPVELPPYGYMVAYNWAEDNSTVTGVAVPYAVGRPTITETVNAIYEVTTNPTCSTIGVGTWTSEEFESDLFTEQTKEVKIDALGHDPVKHDAVEETCTESGNTAYWSCTRCSKFFADENAEEEIAEGSWVIPPAGHDWDVATYTWSSDNSSVTAKHVCKTDSTHFETETVETTSEMTKAPTCEEKGDTTYTAVFTNGGFDKQTKTVNNIPAKGHDWGDPTYTWAEDNSTVTAKRICRNDASHVDTETVDVTSEVTKAPTCETMGETTYTAVFTNSAFAEQTKTEADVPALGHEWSGVIYTWSADNKTVTATRICMHDFSHEETETANVTSEVTKAPTCLEWGATTYKAVFANSAFEEQTKTQYDISPVGHDWGEPEYTWSDDNSSVTATRVCGNDASHVETETVSTTSEVTKAPTCEEKGETTYTAVFVNKAFAKQTKTAKNIPAIGHVWGEPTYTWAIDNSSVTATRVCENDASHVETETVSTTSEVTKAPTCEGKGETTYTAVFVNKAFAKQTRTANDVPAKGHDWEEPTYKWAEDNSSVTATRVCKNNKAHIETETVRTTAEEAKAPTCTAKGDTKYTAIFTNSAFKVQTKTVNNIPALGHDWGEVTYSWTRDNSKAVATRVCKNNHDHVDTETVNTTSEVTKKATCTAQGTTTYKAVFKNSVFEEQTKEVVNIPATGHKWGEPTYIWSDDNRSVTATRVCANDASHVETETVRTTAEEVKAPSCTAKGDTKYTAIFKNSAFSVQSKTVTDVPAKGHSWGEVTYSWTKDNTKAVATRICINDRNHVDTEEVDTTSEITRKPTCNAAGETTYYAEFTKEAFSKQSIKVANIKALGHDWGEWKVTKAATEYAEGIEVRTCKNDPSHTEERAIPKLGHVHKLVKTAAVAATCTEAGNSEYWTCSECGKYFSDAEGTKEIEKDSWITKATGHKYGAYKLTTKATATKSGKLTRTCKHCGKKQTKLVSPVLAKAKVTSNTKAKITWKKVNMATRYVVYFANCGKDKVVKVATTTKLSYTAKNLIKGDCYKFKVNAQRKINGKWKTISTGLIGHFASGNLTHSKKETNAKSVTVDTTKVELNKNGTYKIKATVAPVKAGKSVIKKSHAALRRYMSSNTKVATVTKKGVIKAKGIGTCKIYVVAVNGIWKTITVTVR